MISCQNFFQSLKEKTISFFTGIPDSSFKDWMSFLIDQDEKILTHIVPCNECEAIALAAGYYLATNKIGVVYMQNSGLGKTVNPLTSLCDSEVYSIPMILMIGWRGEPGKVDEPQHKKMGKITLTLLDTLNIPYAILKPDLNYIQNKLDEAFEYFKKKKSPFAFIIKPNFFEKYIPSEKTHTGYNLTREECIELILDNLKDIKTIIISSTGYTSREIFEYLESRKTQECNCFFNIGSMGCASSIGLGIALNKNQRVLVFDGDAAAIMQMGAFTTIGANSPSNYFHIIFDNRAHESTGGQPTNSSYVNFLDVALASNYKFGRIIQTREELLNIIPEIKLKEGPILYVIKISQYSRSNLKRPKEHPIDYKERFMNYLMALK